MCHVSNVICHVSGVMCQVSGFMCQVSGFFFFGKKEKEEEKDKVVELVSERSIINWAISSSFLTTPVDFPLFVQNIFRNKAEAL